MSLTLARIRRPLTTQGLLALILAVALALVTLTTAYADEPPAEQRPGAVGAVLTSQPMALAPQLRMVATGVRVTYVTTDSTGRRIVASAAVLRPKQLLAPGRHKVIAWAHGTAGSADRCAPSRFPNLFPSPDYADYANTLAGYLRAGYTVTATDYPGLGTPGPHPYLVGDSEARAVIDSVRAARNLYPSLSPQWVVTGHSQGGQAALFAGEIADTYGSGLRLKGVVAIAPASNLDLLAQTIAGTPGQGYLVLGIYGLAAIDPTVDPTQILAAPALARVDVIEDGCFDDILPAFADLTADELLVGGELAPDVVARFAVNNPARQPSTAPVLLPQGTLDDTVPLEATQLLLSQECAKGVAASLVTYPGQGHDSVLGASAGDVLNYVNARFAGAPAPSDC